MLRSHQPLIMSQNYKETLNLPRTEFPMKANLAAREPELLRVWEETRLYQQIQKSRKDRELFVLHDGPPFANGDVHMGTALNKILKDFVVKSQTMLGKRAPYVPGWDCHGLPIEYKVVRESRDLAPLEVRKRCEAFARKFIDIQREQFKRLGVFGDWEHPYLTMDPAYEAEILRAFAVFVEKGLVYESLKPVFWSTGAQTALAEAEVEYQERDDTAVFVKFPIISVSPTNSFPDFVPPPVSNQPANRCNLFPATNSNALVHNIPFCRALPWSCWPSSSPWTVAPVRSTSHPATAKTITCSDQKTVSQFSRRSMITAATLTRSGFRSLSANMSSTPMPTLFASCASAACSWPNKIFIIAIPIAGARRRRSSFARLNNFLSASTRSAAKRWMPFIIK